ncbi:MAG: hypothetical protein K6G12_02965 [Lachnospiraceae bacterium]|nr:hypothetical protein [Lachnospiraceae bacterium]
MMETTYQKEKVNNEVEWCQIYDIDLKEKIEKVLLKNRVSYCILFEKPRLFSSDKREKYVFCVNALQKETADNAIAEIGDLESLKGKISFLNRKVEKTYI